jgi:erythromycin esterase-like protein
MEEKYSLDFRDFSWCNPYASRSNGSISFYYIDSALPVNGKPPLEVRSTKKMPLRTGLDTFEYRMYNVGEKKADVGHVFRFALNQDMALPDDAGNANIRLMLNSRCLGVQRATLKVSCFDAQEKQVCCDSIDINKERWGEDTLLLAVQNAKIMAVEVACSNDYIAPNQSVWIDRLRIEVNGADFNSRKEDSIYLKPDDGDVHPLSSGSESADAHLKVFEGKKVIGLGEAVPGSREVKQATIQCIKSLILNNRCRVVLLNENFDKCLIWDLYARGVAPEDALSKMPDAVPYREFLTWLRCYNAAHMEQVRIVGLNESFISDLSHNFDVMNSLGITNVRMEALTNAASRQDVTLFTYVENEARELIRKHGYWQDDRWLYQSRDYAWQLADTALSLYLGANDCAVLLSSGLDVGKIPTERRTYYTGSGRTLRRSLGSYFAEKYGDQYFCASIVAGTGRYMQSETMWNPNRNRNRPSRFKDTLVIRSLDYPEAGSVERFFLHAPTDYFYYSAKALPEAICMQRLVFYHDKRQIFRQFQPSSLKNRFDAFIFVRNSNPL